MTINQRQLILL